METIAQRERWPELSQRFGAHLMASGHSEDTAKSYVNSAWIFYRWCCDRELDVLMDMTEPILERWLAEQVGHYAASTAHVRLSAVKAFYKWKVLQGKITSDPSVRLTVKKRKPRARPPLQTDELTRLVEHCKTEEERLWFLVGSRCGLRVSELAGIRVDDLYPASGYILIHGKGGKERYVVPGGALMLRLVQFLARKRISSGIVWPGIRGLNREQARFHIRAVQRRVARYAEVEHYHPHRMRTTFAVDFLRETHDLHSLQLLMGHASVETTARYAAYGADEAALQMMAKFNSRDSIPPEQV